jgi:UDPglucose 6-dehydrogenase
LRRLRDLLGELRGQTVALLGLTYKPGTDTLRRSLSVELAKALHATGVVVRAHDPAVAALPDELQSVLSLHATVTEALAGASAVIIATQWGDYRDLDSATFADVIVLDANSFLRDKLEAHPRYYSVGRGGSVL